MIFKGYSKTFSVLENNQYETISNFWDYMIELFGIENLIGLGFNWKNNSIEYIIGLKSQDINPSLVIPDATYKEIILPDVGWIEYEGKTSDLPKIYEKIYKDGKLVYELESFDNSGNCKILIHR